MKGLSKKLGEPCEVLPKRKGGGKMEDSRIIELYESRDQQAISQSDMKYGGYCYSVGYNILGVREDTEECVNETWLRAWNSIPPQKPRMLSAFFGRITRNIAFDRYRASKAAKRGKGEIAAVLEELDECIPDNDTTESLCDGRHLEGLINEFLGELQERDRNIFLQRYWFATPIKEISKKHAMNLNTVKASLFRSRNKLKALLEKEGVLL